MKLCFLSPYTTTEEALKELFASQNLSSSQIKKSLSVSLRKKKIESHQEFELPKDLYNYKEIYPLFTGSERPIFLETKGPFVAIHKPPKVHSHPLHYLEGDNILSYLRQENRPEFSQVLKVNPSSYDRGLLHRLDYETSGLLLMTGDPDLHQKIRENFDHYVVKKTYLALVEGNFNKEGFWTHYLAAMGAKKALRISVNPDTYQGEYEKATLSVTKQEYNPQTNRSLLKIGLHTGRRHQIRIQLKALGFPIIGDTLYGGASFERLCLHAFQYKIGTQEQEFLFQDSHSCDFI